MNPVQNFEIFAPKLVDKKEYLSAGHRACQGCGEVLALRHILKALGDDIVVANATGCMEIISSALPPDGLGGALCPRRLRERRRRGIRCRSGP